MKILILCTGNSCRSQMAEGYFKSYGQKAELEAYSAGLETHGLNPKAVYIMAEDGINISFQTSDNLSTYLEEEFDFVITVCDHAQEQCPVFHGAKKYIHKSFPDPAKATGSQDEIMAEFRNTRNEIKNFVLEFIQNNQQQPPPS